MNDNNKQKPSILLKLSSRGTYTWSIELPIENDITSPNYDSDGSIAISRLKQIDNKLKDAFPNYARQGAGRTQSFREFDNE